MYAKQESKPVLEGLKEISQRLARFLYLNFPLLFLLTVFLLLFLEWKLRTFQFLASQIASFLEVLGVNIVFLSDNSIRRVTLYTCSAFIQAYAALIAIIYSIGSIYLQTKYGYVVAKILARRLYKPLIILTLFILVSFSIMAINMSDSTDITMKHVLLILVEIPSLIIAFIPLYTEVVSLLRMRPSEIIEALLETKRLNKDLRLIAKKEKAMQTTIDLLDRLRGATTILRYLLEEGFIDEAESAMLSYYNIGQAYWELGKDSRLVKHALNEFVEDVYRKIVQLVIQTQPYKPMPSSLALGILVSSLVKPYLKIEGDNMHLLRRVIRDLAISLAINQRNLAYYEAIYDAALTTIITHIDLEGKPSQKVISELINPLIQDSISNIQHLVNTLANQYMIPLQQLQQQQTQILPKIHKNIQTIKRLMQTKT